MPHFLNYLLVFSCVLVYNAVVCNGYVSSCGISKNCNVQPAKLLENRQTARHKSHRRFVGIRNNVLVAETFSPSMTSISANAVDASPTTVKFASAILGPALAARLHKVLLGGFLSGMLHAVTGPDHLAALLPSSIGRSGLYALQIGSVWGLGHSVSATGMGMLAFLLKDTVGNYVSVTDRLTNIVESVVGASLMTIGLLGVKENWEPADESESDQLWAAAGSLSSGSGSSRTSSSGDATSANGSYQAIWAVFLNGLLHGFSWDGASALIPALTMSSWAGAVSFLLSYAFGTIAAMSGFAFFIAKLSTSLTDITKSKAVPRLLSLSSSILAVIIGAYWIIKVYI